MGAVGVLLLLGVVLSPCGQNELTLLRRRRAFEAIVHPPGSVLLREASAVGLLEGNGNHCDFFVGQLRAAPLSREALRRAYPPDVMVEFGLEDAPTGPREALLREVATVPPREGMTVYVVSTYEQRPPGLDPRCH